MNLLKQYKEEFGYTVRYIGKQLNVDNTYISKCIRGTKRLSPQKIETLKEVIRLEKLIRCKPSDVVLLIHELKRLTEGR